MPGLHDVAGLHHEDAVTAEDGVHSVGDGQYGPVPQTMLDYLLENQISLNKVPDAIDWEGVCNVIMTDLKMSVSVRVHIRCGLVDEDDFAGGEDGPGEAEELLLARREAAALLSDLAAVTWWRYGQEVRRRSNIDKQLTHLRAWRSSCQVCTFL